MRVRFAHEKIERYFREHNVKMITEEFVRADYVGIKYLSVSEIRTLDARKGYTELVRDAAPSLQGLKGTQIDAKHGYTPFRLR